MARARLTDGDASTNYDACRCVAGSGLVVADSLLTHHLSRLGAPLAGHATAVELVMHGSAVTTAVLVMLLSTQLYARCQM